MDEKDAAHPAPTDVDPNEVLIERARGLVQSTGRASIMVYLRKDGRDFPQPLRLRDVDELADLARYISEEHGGGDFDFRVRVGGKFACGWTPISIQELDDEDDDLDDPESDELADEDDEEPTASPQEVAALVLTQLREDQERKAQAESAEIARTKALADAISGPLLARIDSVEKKIPAAPAAPAVDPRLEALTAQVTALTQQLQVKEKDEQAQRITNVESKLSSQIADLAKALSAPKRKKAKGSLDLVLSELMKIAAVDKAFEALRARSSEGEGGGLLENALQVFEEPLKNVLKEAAKNVEKSAKASLRSQREPQSDGASPAASDLPGDLVSWLQLVFKEQRRVLDVEFVRASLASPALGPSIEKLATATTPDQLFAVVNEILGPTVTDAIKKEPPAYAQGVVQLCQALAKTIHTAKTTPPPAPEKDAEEPKKEPPK